ncbi:MAG: acyl-carrier-protein S-malonyltransferase [Candidatus Magnetoglobus multicellularis str. Araruama]|uniref:Acyl-carrier-protein S-malonyltransferase n=1 Tax=Candidatus Magnetoglobus multicellularis str. Araruama TaxID=890399 RepID=A0A1V1NYD3_9BACT|nr:MAG: acyl-carrier-protein S-malonyltransferase [Candidatus Magnetoglobus multicellularis str. Araruama]
MHKMRILVDYNMEGQATLIWDTLVKEGWRELIDLEMFMFVDVGLAPNSDDRTVWRFAQQYQMLLLTNNRSDNEENSLEQTIREENTMMSYPVLTVATLHRIGEREYRIQCIERLIDIIVDIDNYLGTGRIFIP